MRRSFAMLVPMAALSLVLLLAPSCGSGSLSKADYISKGDALCQDFQQRGKAVPQPTTDADVVPYLDSLIKIADETYADFTALKPPEDATSVHQALLSSLSAGTAKIKEARTAAAAGDQAAMEKALNEAADVGGASDAEAKAYGFKVCGSEQDATQGGA